MWDPEIFLKESPQNSGTTHHNTNHQTDKAYHFISFFSGMAATAVKQ
jgi:hypothetical protein